MTEQTVRVELSKCRVRRRPVVRMLSVATYVLTLRPVLGALIVVGVPCSWSLATVNRGGVVGVSSDGVLEAEGAERRDAVHGDKKLKIGGGELEPWWCV